MERPSWAPEEIDLSKPSVARVYDYYLGGSHNFEVDREMAAQAVAMWPELPRIMQENRAFMRRAVRHLLDDGITQFLDIGSGIPTVGSTHEVVRNAGSDAPVVYVDLDPVAVAHGRAILAGDPRAAMLGGDLRQPQDVLEAAAATGLVDLERPLGVLLVAVLHFVHDDEGPADIMATLHKHTAPGSRLVVSHASGDGRPDKAAEHQDLYRSRNAPMHMRGRAEIGALLSGFDLVDPGLVFLPEWRPEPGAEPVADAALFAGIAGVGIRT
ncbi:SAM-dependent methyltransferase [Yinghuangia seranimata]|uniref:SAM-dependent methyltransferase n=1 Tax=Yinghuangia seranimata TaxID=408067 RepID=UPI00248B53A0|nr:SAM-dependent methyltransferase [Yinghuangia seranimata]MDI2131578.1 SAM-dependent methyltransferase [Yinghuangia seranimata]